MAISAQTGDVVEHHQENSHTISDFESQSEKTEASESGQSEQRDRTENAPSSAQANELQVLQDKHLRLAAEFENYKRLSQRDQREYSRFANEQLLRELLPVVDNLERAIASAKAARNVETVIEGVELTLKQFLELLGKFGIRPIISVGQPFDPSRHEAATRIEKTEVPDNTVVEEYRKGYLLHERVLRPAMVTVATGGGSDRAAGHAGGGETTDHGRSVRSKKPGASA
jgi:molecular chaperone GrpE